jgi:hypothetical protein
MPTDFDNLITSARPTVPPTAREGVLEYIEAQGAVASGPGPLRMLGRVAALVVLALASGAVAALFAPRPEAPNELAELQAQVEDLKQTLPERNLRAELRQIEQSVAELEQQQAAFDRAVLTAVTNSMDRREAARMEEWRTRHVTWVREYQARRTEAAVSALREELSLTDDQAAQVRDLLKQAEDKAIELIGSYYGRGRYQGIHEEFAALAADTREDLQALLDAQQRERLEGAAIVGNAPEDWAPRDDFRDGTDVDVWVNWMNVSRE